MVRSVVVVVVVSCFFSGCLGTSRVLLPAPPAREAPLAEREAAWETLKPVGSRSGQFVGNAWSPKSFVVLAGGARVEDPDDLVAIVGDGPVKAAADRARDAEDDAFAWEASAWGLMALGSAGMFGGLGLVAASNPPGDGTIPPEAEVGLVTSLAGGAVMLTALIPAFVGASRRGEALVETDTAFILYGDALRKRLDLPDTRHAVALEVSGPSGDPAELR